MYVILGVFQFFNTLYYEIKMSDGEIVIILVTHAWFTREFIVDSVLYFLRARNCVRARVITRLLVCTVFTFSLQCDLYQNHMDDKRAAATL